MHEEQRSRNGGRAASPGAGNGSGAESVDPKVRRSPAKAPAWHRQAIEVLWPLEAASLPVVAPFLRLLGRGDQHPVLVLPGFGGDDASTLPLRWAIRGQGYWVHSWRLGANLGPTTQTVAGMRSRIACLHEQHGRSISLIGWSLGGIFARALAREHPDKIRHVITLASPYRRIDGDRGPSAPQALWNRLRSSHDPGFEIMRIAEHAREPLAVPATSIYSRNDGFAPWQQCIDDTSTEAPNPRAENIEVRGSHIGLGSNPAALIAVLDRLSQPEGEWRPFRPPPPLRWLYPTPATWTAHPAGRQRSSRFQNGDTPAA